MKLRKQLGLQSEDSPNYYAPIHAQNINPPDGFDSTAFFTGSNGLPSIVTGADLEEAIPDDEISHMVEVDRYWAVFPYSFVSICKSERHNEYRYYVVEPTLSELELEVVHFVSEKLRNRIRSAEKEILSSSATHRQAIIRQEVMDILEMYDLYRGEVIGRANEESPVSDVSKPDDSDPSFFDSLPILGSEDSQNEKDTSAIPEYSGKSARLYGGDSASNYLPVVGEITGHPAYERVVTTDNKSPHSEPKVGSKDACTSVFSEDDSSSSLLSNLFSKGENKRESPDGESSRTKINAFTETDANEQTELGISIEELKGFCLQKETDAGLLNDFQAYKLFYYIERNFIGFKKIDPIKNDLYVEDISCDGYNQPVFVYHSEYEQVLSNVSYGSKELDSFVTSLAQFAGKEVSRRKPQADATLPDGSRGQLTLGKEVSDSGTNYTIRQFKEIPFTPIDLINWKTYSLDDMTLLWLAAEHQSAILVAGGTASGKTTTLNALSLFISPTDKVVTIEDTRELELPQRNWVPMMTREGTGKDDEGEIDEFDLLESALRQRPDYILFSEVRGEEGQSLFQVMSTGHTSFTTFHADNVDEVIKRFTTDPINVSRSLFMSLDLILMQGAVYVDGRRVRRGLSVTEITDYTPETDKLTVVDISEWNPAKDVHERNASPHILQEVSNRMGWSEQDLTDELEMRKAVLSYLVANEITAYDDVAAAIQGFMTDQEAIMELIANDCLEDAIHDLKELGNVSIQNDPAAEQAVPRPIPQKETQEQAEQFLTQSKQGIFKEYIRPEGWSPDVSKIEDQAEAQESESPPAPEQPIKQSEEIEESHATEEPHSDSEEEPQQEDNPPREFNWFGDVSSDLEDDSDTENEGGNRAKDTEDQAEQAQNTEIVPDLTDDTPESTAKDSSADTQNDVTAGSEPKANEDEGEPKQTAEYQQAVQSTDSKEEGSDSAAVPKEAGANQPEEPDEEAVDAPQTNTGQPEEVEETSGEEIKGEPHTENDPGDNEPEEKDLAFNPLEELEKHGALDSEGSEPATQESDD